MVQVGEGTATQGALLSNRQRVVHYEQLWPTRGQRGVADCAEKQAPEEALRVTKTHVAVIEGTNHEEMGERDGHKKVL